MDRSTPDSAGYWGCHDKQPGALTNTNPQPGIGRPSASAHCGDHGDDYTDARRVPGICKCFKYLGSVKIQVPAKGPIK